MPKQRSFNITGPCIPALHYMVDTSEKIDLIIRDYIDAGEYFTINRARQYGKTTTLVLLFQKLRSRYIVIDMSFEGMGSTVFQSETAFIGEFITNAASELADNDVPQAVIDSWSRLDGQPSFAELDRKISTLITDARRDVILMIDEVDKTSSNQLFLDFLGMLREKYIRFKAKGKPTFKSVILAGVHDIKNLKMKLRPEESHSYNSPWNIAAQFDVDMSFSAPEIATMLDEYEKDFHTGMDIAAVSERLYYYTSGYPFLVSLLCKTIADEKLPWTCESVDEAEKRVLKTNNTLFDDVVKNLVNHPSFGALLEGILLRGEEVAFEIRNPDIDLGLMFGILNERDNRVCVSNVVFETLILNYYISISEPRGEVSSFVADSRPAFVQNGKLNMPLVLERFCAFMRSEYRDEDGDFIEREGRLLFLSFLKPIINGTGHYVVEPQTRGNRRMDVVVFYGGEEHIVELKIWHGEQAANEAYEQLTGYLHSQEQTKGYLLSFCNNKVAPREGGTFTYNGCDITEVIVAYRDKK